MTTPALGRRLGDLLVESAHLDRELVENAARQAELAGEPIGETLQRKFGIEEQEIYRQLAKQGGLPFERADTLLKLADHKVAARIPKRFRDFHRVIPICVTDSTVIVATCELGFYVPELSAALDVDGVDVRIVTPTDYERLHRALELGQFGAPDTPAPVTRVPDLTPQPQTIDAETIALFDAIILDAVANRASDIHFEMYGDRPRLRIRVDGDLRDVEHFHFNAERFVTLVNVGKVRSRLDIAERRAPQGGRFSTRVQSQLFDVRVQTQPSLHAEHLVLRLLPQDKKPPQITDLGFSSALAASYERLLLSPGGLILVVGPTGSGKSTTLYAGLQLLAQDVTRKVMSVEDPIEYAIDGVQQAQVLPEVGFTFANAMRAFVREDPDVILVGEIRDGETAMEAIRASQTGHLVLSTLHCNDTVDAVQRLTDLGMHPNSVASELLAVISQRLAKRICTSCKTEVPPDAELAGEVFPNGVPADFRSYKGNGCPRCHGKGSYGRVAVAEFLAATPELRMLISRRPVLDELRAAARAAGLRPLRDEALALVQGGVIAFTELRDMISPEFLAIGGEGESRWNRA